MGGLARGIERNQRLVRKAVEGVAGDMVVSPKLADIQAIQAQGVYCGEFYVERVLRKIEDDFFGISCIMGSMD